jgi:hypothetical protein
MTLSDRYLDEFIALYQKHYGVVLERNLALSKGLKLCALVRVVEEIESNGNEYAKRED